MSSACGLFIVSLWPSNLNPTNRVAISIWCSEDSVLMCQQSTSWSWRRVKSGPCFLFPWGNKAVSQRRSCGNRRKAVLMMMREMRALGVGIHIEVKDASLMRKLTTRSQHVYSRIDRSEKGKSPIFISPNPSPPFAISTTPSALLPWNSLLWVNPHVGFPPPSSPQTKSELNLPHPTSSFPVTLSLQTLAYGKTLPILAHHAAAQWPFDQRQPRSRQRWAMPTRGATSRKETGGLVAMETCVLGALIFRSFKTVQSAQWSAIDFRTLSPTSAETDSPGASPVRCVVGWSVADIFECGGRTEVCIRKVIDRAG